MAEHDTETTAEEWGEADMSEYYAVLITRTLANALTAIDANDFAHARMLIEVTIGYVGGMQPNNNCVDLLEIKI